MVARAGKRRAALYGAALLALLGVVSAALGLGEGARGPEQQRSAAITGLRATLLDQETPLATGAVAWTTRWRLCWDPVPGASAYLLTTVTSEGVSPISRLLDQRCYTLTVASGTARASGQRPGRRAQLSLMEVQLAVSVAARLSDGSNGPPSPDIPVAAPYP